MLLTTSTEKFRLLSSFDAINLAFISPKEAKSLAIFLRLVVSEICILLLTSFTPFTSQITLVNCILASTFFTVE